MHVRLTPSVTAVPCQTFGVPLACSRTAGDKLHALEEGAP